MKNRTFPNAKNSAMRWFKYWVFHKFVLILKCYEEKKKKTNENIDLRFSSFKLVRKSILNKLRKKKKSV